MVNTLLYKGPNIKILLIILNFVNVTTVVRKFIIIYIFIYTKYQKLYIKKMDKNKNIKLKCAIIIKLYFYQYIYIYIKLFFKIENKFMYVCV